MAEDPYTPPVADQPGVPDPADVELADYIVRRSWRAGAGALALACLSPCFNPLFLLTVGSASMGIDAIRRHVRLDPEFAPLVGGRTFAPAALGGCAVVVSAAVFVMGMSAPPL